MCFRISDVFLSGNEKDFHKQIAFYFPPLVLSRSSNFSSPSSSRLLFDFLAFPHINFVVIFCLILYRCSHCHSAISTERLLFSIGCSHFFSFFPNRFILASMNELANMKTVPLFRIYTQRRRRRRRYRPICVLSKSCICMRWR